MNVDDFKRFAPIRIIEEFHPKVLLVLLEPLDEYCNLTVAICGREQLRGALDEQRGLARRIADDLWYDRFQDVILVADYISGVERVAQVHLKAQSQLSLIDVLAIEAESNFILEF